MNAFFYPSNRGINFAKIRGFKVTDYTRRRLTDEPPKNRPEPRNRGRCPAVAPPSLHRRPTTGLTPGPQVLQKSPKNAILQRL